MPRSCLAPIVLAGALAAQPVLRLPQRPPTALRGSEFVAALDRLPVAEREALLVHELASGNVPRFLRRLVPIAVRATVGGRPRDLVFWCTPDYLGCGDDADWMRMPLTPTLAQQVADTLDCVLPTRRMVDAIWAQATVKLAPYPFSPSQYDILSFALFYRHHQEIERAGGGRSPGALVAGIKKDVVASALIASWPGRVVIYGWHRLDGSAIQPLSKVHIATYADYSHGARLVSRRVQLDGVWTTVDAVLADPDLHVLLSDEGPIASWRYPVAAAETLPFADPFPASGAALRGWRAKFTQPLVVPAPRPPPSGDATVLRVMDPAGGTDSLRLSPGLVRDVAVSADLFCEHRPQLSADGFERIGVFVRDRAQGAFDGTRSQQGACYALTWDSHDGRVQCLRVAGGVLRDLLPQPLQRPGTAWRRLRLEASGSSLRFSFDGEVLLEAVDPIHPAGEVGIGYHEYFTTDAHMRGTRADGFFADVPGAFALDLDSDAAGELALACRRGPPGDLHFTALTARAGAFPFGWFWGIDPTWPELSALAGSGHPAFIGRLDPSGRSSFRFAGLPSGRDLFGVALIFGPSLRGPLPSPPVRVTLR